MAIDRARHPGLCEALLAAARITAKHRGERHRFRSRGDAVAQALETPSWLSRVVEHWNWLLLSVA